MAPLGEAVEITVVGGALTGEATVSWPVDPPDDGSTPVIATWVDGTWTPVPSVYDDASGTVTATVDHLSWWQPWTWDLGAIAERAFSSFYGIADTSAAPCDAPDLTDGYRATIENMGTALSGCASVIDGTFEVSVKNRRQSSFSIELFDGWTGSVNGGGDFSSMLTQSLLDLSGRRFVIIPGGETAVIRGTVAPGARVSMPVLQDLFTWTIDGLMLAGQVYALGSGYVGDTSTVASVVRQTSDRLEKLRDGIECVADANGLLTSATGTSDPSAAATELLPTIWSCGKLLAPEGSPIAVLSALVSLAFTPFVMIYQLGEMGVDIFTGEDTRRLIVWRENEPAPPVVAPNDSGLEGAAIQLYLNMVGYGPLDEDGQLGPASQAAIRQFQLDNSLPATGIPDVATGRLLATQAGEFSYLVDACMYLMPPRTDSMYLSCSLSSGLVDATWETWTSEGGTGSGRVFERDCESGCINGEPTYVDVTIEAVNPERWVCGDSTPIQLFTLRISTLDGSLYGEYRPEWSC